MASAGTDKLLAKRWRAAYGYAASAQADVPSAYGCSRGIRRSFPCRQGPNAVERAAILAGLVQPFGKGISNMSAEGWFDFGAAWLIWGVPGTLFAMTAISFARRREVTRIGTALGLLGGAAFLALLGLLIG